ncbi:MAG TPA: ATP-binding protein [Candidatus Atribacteria bacterium]|nr:ATP-binding protein [Candidatus Atribacteria bacterium]HPT79228.1 ATP-binding protein [Candidatus Atribacteria bacterium]
MKDNLLRETLREYDELRLQEQAALREREAEVMRTIPELASLRHAFITAMAKRARALIQNADATAVPNELIDKDQLKKKERELLVQNGYPEDYLTLRYRCELCRDTGYTGDLVKEKCRCLIQRLIEKTYSQSDLADIERESFDTFDPNVFPDEPLEESNLTQRQYMLQLKTLLMDYAAEFPDNPRKNILFSGKTGLGKTFLLNCLAGAILKKGYTVLKITSYNLFEQLFRSAMQKADEGPLTLKERIFSVDVLIIDDVGTETKRNNFTAEELFNILNERCLKDKHTFLSTNLTLPDLKEWYSDRVTSRLFDNRSTMLIRFLGRDIRLLQKRPTK